MRGFGGRRVSLLPMVRRTATAKARRVLPRSDERGGQSPAGLALPARRRRGAARPVQHLARRAGRRCRLARRRGSSPPRTVSARLGSAAAQRPARTRRSCRGDQVLTSHGFRVRALTICTVPGCPHARPCPEHRDTRRRGSTSAWRKLRDQVLARDRYACRECGGPAVAVHHVVLRSAGGRDEAGNLRSLCDRCHAAKHAPQ
jgi:5-methylcytosine-specific restriction enzyme A